MLITKKIEIDMGHRVPNHKSKCRNIHGHRYTIEVGVNDFVITKRGDSSEGMVIDYGTLKQIMMLEIDAVFDHSFIISDKDELIDTFRNIRDTMDMKINVVSFIPTAENLAEYWYHILQKELVENKIKIKYVKVWETPTSMAKYEE